jgi:hypothetical protein
MRMIDEPLWQRVQSRRKRPRARPYGFPAAGLAAVHRDLRDDGPHGVDARFFQNEDLLYSRRFDTRALAVLYLPKTPSARKSAHADWFFERRLGSG